MTTLKQKVAGALSGRGWVWVAIIAVCMIILAASSMLIIW